MDDLDEVESQLLTQVLEGVEYTYKRKTPKGILSLETRLKMSQAQKRRRKGLGPLMSEKEKHAAMMARLKLPGNEKLYEKYRESNNQAVRRYLEKKKKEG